MNKKKWIWGSLRTVGYFILIWGLYWAGQSIETNPTLAHTLDLTPCSRLNGYGEHYFAYNQNISYEYSYQPQPSEMEELKYDIEIQSINCSTLLLRARVGGEKGFITPTNVTSNLEYGSLQTSIPLHYNVSRGEYVAIFDVEPYWEPEVHIELYLFVNFSLNGIKKVTVLETPQYFFTYDHPYTPIFLTVGIICVVISELFIYIIRKYRVLRMERRKDQELLRLLRQQNKEAYESALRQVQEDHNKLIQQIKLADRQEGGP